jgi:hypothetical protein
MSKRNTTIHRSMLDFLTGYQVRTLFLPGLFLLTFSLIAYSHQDPNVQKSQQIKKGSTPPRRGTPVRKTKLPKAKPKTQSKIKETAQTKVETTTTPNIGASAQSSTYPPKVDIQPAGEGSILIDFSSFKLDPYHEPELQVLLNGNSLAVKGKISDTLLELENIPNGRCTLTFKHPTIEDLQREVEVKINGRVHLNPVFNIVRGKLIVESENGAKIFLDDKYEMTILRDNKAIIFAALGEHSLQITKEGFTTYQETIFVTPGEELLKQHLTPKTPVKF